MKKLAVVCVLLLSTSRLLYPLDLTTHRRVVINGFENRESPEYDYVAEVLRAALFQQASRLPYLTLSERKRALLAENLARLAAARSEDSAQENGALEAPGPPDIPYRLQVSVTMDGKDPDEFPLVISGSYRVETGPREPETLFLEVQAVDTLTGEEEASHRGSLPLAAFLEDPSTLARALFQELLRFRSIQVHLEVTPADALIFLDGDPVGTGSYQGLVPPGIHRVTARREGYREYSDLVRMEERISMRIQLEPGPRLRSILVDADVEGATVYLDNQPVGTTPLEVAAPPQGTITLVKEGYVTEMVPLEQVPAGKKLLYVSMRPPDRVESLRTRAEEHRTRARLYSYAGFGLLALAVLFGVEATLNRQRADLYEGSDPERYDQALRASSTFRALSVSSSLLTGGSLMLSFHHTVSFFRAYRDAGTTRVRWE